VENRPVKQKLNVVAVAAAGIAVVAAIVAVVVVVEEDDDGGGVGGGGGGGGGDDDNDDDDEKQLNTDAMNVFLRLFLEPVELQSQPVGLVKATLLTAHPHNTLSSPSDS